MEITLCGQTGCCPKVLTTKSGAEIGEQGNLVKLKPQEWNELVDAVKGGKIGKI